MGIATYWGAGNKNREQNNDAKAILSLKSLIQLYDLLLTWIK